MDSGEASLMAIKGGLGEAKVLALLKLHLLELNELLNLSRPMGEVLIDRIADNLLKRYWYLNMAEIHLVLDRGASGDYGQVLMCNLATVMRWFAQYDTERLELVEERQMEQHERYKETYRDKPRISYQ